MFQEQPSTNEEQEMAGRCPSFLIPAWGNAEMCFIHSLRRFQQDRASVAPRGLDSIPLLLASMTYLPRLSGTTSQMNYLHPTPSLRSSPIKQSFGETEIKRKEDGIRLLNGNNESKKVVK